ncbi:MAG TPA: chorismate-binding protein, partial [Patescibacteria group bacterium]|nr:chorismate-binding protein [Patescibacteria group bacterium]
MKRQVIPLKTDFFGLLQKLSPQVSNACLLTGTTTDGWKKRIAWNPCDTYTLENSEKPDDSFFEFINNHQRQKHLIIGFLSYDLGYSLYGIKKTAKDKMSLPNAVVLAYDNYLETDGENMYATYTDADFIKEIHKIERTKSTPLKIYASNELKYTWNRRSYKKAFERIKNHIYEGLIYQINLTQELELKSNMDSRTVFGALARKNFGKMMAYFETDDLQIIS